MAMTTNQEYGYISALITIDKDVFIYTQKQYHRSFTDFIFSYFNVEQISVWQACVVLFFSGNGKKGKRLIQRKGALIPFYPTTDCLSQNITFSHESHYWENNTKNGTLRAQKTCKKWHTIPGYFLKTYMFFFLSKIIPIKKNHRQSRSHKCCFNQFDSVVCFVPSRWWRL